MTTLILVLGGCWAFVEVVRQGLASPCEPPATFDSYEAPAWSPVGSQIAFTSTRASACNEVYIVDARGGTPTKLTDGERDVVSLAWSPDGTRIAYARSAEYAERRLSVINLPDAQEQAVPGDVIEFAWSPDGEELAYTTWESDAAAVHILVVDTGEVRVLPIDEGGEGVLDWSPDGTEIVYTDSVDGRLHAARLDGGAGRVVSGRGRTSGTSSRPRARLLLKEDFARSTEWWPREHEEKYRTEYQDGGYRILVEESGIYASERDIPESSLLRIDVDLTQNSDLGEAGVTCGTLETYYEFSIDAATGRYLVTRAGPEAANSAILAEGTAREAIRRARSANHLTVECRARRPRGPTMFVLAVNGRRIATATDPRGPSRFASTGLRVDGFSGGANVVFDNLVVRRLPALRVVRDLSPDWSSDGQRIVFATRGDIVVVNADGTRLRKLTTGPGQDGSPRWSPDGRRILFSRKRGEIARLHVMRADGTGVRPLRIDPSHGASWLPDSRRIVFSTGKRLRVAEADGRGIRNLLG